MLLTVRKIEVKNFMTHRQESVELPQSGTILLWGPSGAGKCLTAGTTVWGPGGQPMSIRQFVLGRFQEVLGVVGDRIQPVRVTDWHQLGEKPILHITLTDGASIHCADSHPIQTPMGCMRADELAPGYMVGRADPVDGAQRRWVEIESITPKPAMECYDITVDTPEHLYLADGFVVHNSSLLDSIGFALYGLAATRASSLDELRHELYPDQDFGVRVTFGLGENQIQLFRGVEGGKSVVWMVDQDGSMTESPRAVAKQVSELMGGMDSATFFSTYVAQQGEMDSLVKMAGGGRRKFVQRMMGITLLDKVTTQINRELVKTGERIKFLDESMPPLGKKELLEAVAQAEKDCSKAKQDAESFQTELEAVKLQGESLAGQLKEMDQKSQQVMKLVPVIEALQDTKLPSARNNLERISKDLTQAQEAHQRLQKASQQIEKINELEAQAEKLAHAEGFLASLGQLQTDLESSQKALEACLSDFPAPDDPQYTPQALQALVNGLQEQVFGLQNKTRETLERKNALSEDTDCWVCGQNIPDPQALRNDLEKHHKQFAEQLSQAEAQLSQAQEKLTKSQEIENARKDVQYAKEALEKARSQSSGADAQQLRQVRSELQSLAQIKAGLEADRKQAEQIAELEKQQKNLTGQIAQMEEELQAQKKQLADSDYQPEGHQELKEKTEAARARYMELRDNLASCREQIQSQQLAAQTAQAAADQYDSIQKDRRGAEERHGMLKRLETSMKGFKSYLIGQIRPTLQNLTSQHLSSLTDGGMSGVEIDEEYNLQIKDGETMRRIGMCSGGEQARAAFSLRLALTQLVSKRTDTPVGFMIFDEIFGSQDEDHRRAILESLRYLRGIYPQTFLISHSGEIRESDLVDVVVDVPNGDSAGRIQVSGR